jgi:transcriptional regulator with XRE-family HTH domain
METLASRELKGVLVKRRQADVAESLGKRLGRQVSRSNLSKWASGTHTPSYPMMELMRDVLGIEFAWWRTPVSNEREAA